MKPSSRNARQETRRVPIAAAAGEPGDDPPDEPVWGVEGLDELSHALRVLPRPEREVLLLRYIDDLSIEEIAKALDLAAATVESRLRRALKSLREDPAAKAIFEEREEEI